MAAAATVVVVMIALSGIVGGIAMALSGLLHVLSCIPRVEPRIPPARIETGRAFPPGRRRLDVRELFGGLVQIAIAIVIVLPVAFIAVVALVQLGS